MLQIFKAIAFASFVLAAPGVFAEPYVGIEYQQLAGTRTQQSYQTNQVNAVVGYEWALQPDFKHGIEYTGPISSSSAELGTTNVETVLMSVSYRMNYKGLFGRVGYVKLDRDDDDLEVTTTRATLYSVGYEYLVDNTTVLRASRDYVHSSAVSLSGWSLAALFRF
jgi:hypothetical protein